MAPPRPPARTVARGVGGSGRKAAGWAPPAGAAELGWAALGADWGAAAAGAGFDAGAGGGAAGAQASARRATPSAATMGQVGCLDIAAPPSVGEARRPDAPARLAHSMAARAPGAPGGPLAPPPGSAGVSPARPA